MSTGGGPNDQIMAEVGLDASGYREGTDQVVRYARRLEDEQTRLDRAVADSSRRRSDLVKQMAAAQAAGSIEQAERVRVAYELNEQRLQRAVQDSATRQARIRDDAAAHAQRTAARAAQSAEAAAARAANAAESQAQRQAAAAQRSAQAQISAMQAVERQIEREIGLMQAAAREASELEQARLVAAQFGIPLVGGGGGGGGGRQRRQIDAGARAILGFQGAQTLQDAFYGPQYAINNVLALAQMRGGVTNLAKDYAEMGRGAVAWLGRMAAAHPVVTAAVATLGAGVFTLNKGLHDAELGWGDLGAVISNTTPWKTAESLISDTWAVLSDTAAGRAVDSLWSGVKNLVHETANLTLGWDEATEAVRNQNKQLEVAAKLTAEAAEGAKAAAGFQSEEQKEKAAAGKRFGEAFANLGGAEGAPGLIRQVSNSVKDRERIERLFGQASAGDAVAADFLARMLSIRRGIDTSSLTQAMLPKPEDAPEATQEQLLDLMRNTVAGRGLSGAARREIGAGYRFVYGGGRGGGVTDATRPQGISTQDEFLALDRVLRGAGIDAPGLVQQRLGGIEGLGKDATQAEGIVQLQQVVAAIKDLTAELSGRRRGGPPPQAPPGGWQN